MPLGRTRAIPGALVLVLSVALLPGCSNGGGSGSGAPPPATPVVTIATADFSVAESAGAASIAVSITPVATTDVTIPIGLAGTAIDGTDFTAPAAVVISAGSATVTVTATIIDDGGQEPDETLIVSLLPGSGFDLGSPAAVTVTILDDDAFPELTLAVPTLSVLENSGPGSFDILLSNSSLSAVEVDLDLVGSAAVGLDLFVTPNPIAFAPGETLRTVDFTLLDDSIFEGDEELIVTLVNPNGATVGAADTLTLTILEDEPAPSVELADTAFLAAETGGPIVLLVDLSTISALDTVVPFSTSGTTDAADFTIDASPLVIPANALQGSITVQPIDDGIPEGDETIVVTLGAPVGATLGPDDTAVITLASTLPMAEFLSIDTTIAETDGPFDLMVGLSSPALAEASIDFALSGTATETADFTIAMSPLVIPVGAQSGIITVVPVDDGIPEAAETLTVTLVSANGAELGPAAAVTLTLQDDLTAPCNLTYSEPTATYAPGTTIAPNSPTLGCGSADQFEVFPALPAGLFLDPVTGVISGAPSFEQPPTEYDIVASNGAGSTATTISIEIAPRFVLSGSSPNVFYVPALGLASFEVSLFLEEDPGGTPSVYHEIDGYSLGVAFDANEVLANSVAEGIDSTALNGGTGADYFFGSVQPDGITLGVIVSFTQAETLIANGPQEIATVQFSSNPAFLLGNSLGGTSTLQYSGSIGSPPVETLIVHDGMQTVPVLLPMTVTFTP